MPTLGFTADLLPRLTRMSKVRKVFANLIGLEEVIVALLDTTHRFTPHSRTI